MTGTAERVALVLNGRQLNALQASGSDECTEQLARLASQHHTSQYNVAKYGAEGCPDNYVPLSIHSPDLYDEMESRQLMPGYMPLFKSVEIAESGKPSLARLLGPCSETAHTIDYSLLEMELTAAMSDELETVVRRATGCDNKFIKTSKTHPINMSSIIPTELMSIIGSYLQFNNSDESPTIFTLTRTHTLDRLVLCRDKSFDATKIPLPPPIPTHQVPPLPLVLPSRTSLSEAIYSALNSGLSALPKTLAPVSQNPAVTSLSVSVTINGNVDRRALRRQTGIVRYAEEEAQVHLPPRMEKVVQPEAAIDLDLESLSLLQPPPERKSLFEAPTVNYYSEREATEGIVFGNLFLSSCPGKKVRLNGPVNGRTGVCRDVETDMRRMKDTGVGCVVCCLDDAELEFLGSPWSEYSSTARQLGIDVLRIPTPEGLAPLSLSPSTLDAHLAHLIDAYTLKGVPVLVHCRGGIGRAGVIACCWMLKLGLFGWITDAFSDTSESEGGVREDTLELVTRVIRVIRKRRSVKAIETYEQVRFLVEYVEYLRGKRDI